MHDDACEDYTFEWAITQRVYLMRASRIICTRTRTYQRIYLMN
eukprot:COSAG05_NODE_1208_length_5523_cov_14.095686_7_plen_43_part_00